MKKRYYTEEILDRETGELTIRTRTVRPSIAELAMAERYGFDEWDVPTSADISNAVTEVVTELLYTNALIKSGIKSIASDSSDSSNNHTGDSKPVSARGRKPNRTNNHYSEYFSELDYNPEEQCFCIPSAVEDVLSIVRRTSEADTVFPIAQLIRCLRLPVISSKQVMLCLNVSRDSSQHVRIRYAQALARACGKVMNRLDREQLSCIAL